MPEAFKDVSFHVHEDDPSAEIPPGVMCCDTFGRRRAILCFDASTIRFDLRIISVACIQTALVYRYLALLILKGNRYQVHLQRPGLEVASGCIREQISRLRAITVKIY